MNLGPDMERCGGGIGCIQRNRWGEARARSRQVDDRTLEAWLDVARLAEGEKIVAKADDGLDLELGEVARRLDVRPDFLYRCNKILAADDGCELLPATGGAELVEGGIDADGRIDLGAVGAGGARGGLVGIAAIDDTGGFGERLGITACELIADVNLFAAWMRQDEKVCRKSVRGLEAHRKLIGKKEGSA